MKAQAYGTVAERENEEIWELMIDGRVSVEKTNHMGHPSTVSAKGKGQRIRLSTRDRLLAQERIRDPKNDPFTNGMMVRIDSAAQEEPQSDQALTDEDLVSVFLLADENDFKEVVTSMTEVNVRRLKDLASNAKATLTQVAFIDDLIREKWPIGGDTPTYREMMSLPDSER